MTHDEEVQLAKDLRAYFKGEEEAYQAKGSSPIPLALVTEGAKPEEVRAARGEYLERLLSKRASELTESEFAFLARIARDGTGEE